MSYEPITLKKVSRPKKKLLAALDDVRPADVKSTDLVFTLSDEDNGDFVGLLMSELEKITITPKRKADFRLLHDRLVGIGIPLAKVRHVVEQVQVAIDRINASEQAKQEAQEQLAELERRRDKEVDTILKELGVAS